MLFRVEIWSKEFNNWIVLSKHRNQLYADANAETTSKSRKCDARVIFNGKIVTFYKGE